MNNEPEQNLFEADYNEKYYDIVITVCKDGNQLSYKHHKKDRPVTYHEVVGALEIIKGILMMEQGFYNRMKSLKDEEDKQREKLKELDEQIKAKSL